MKPKVEQLYVHQGRTLKRKVTLRYPADYATSTLRNQAVTGVYTTETLTLKLWTGDGITAVTMSNSTVAWLSATDGTLTFTLDNADTATLAAGWYRLEIYVTSASEPYTCYTAMVNVLPTAGSTTADKTYCTMAQVVDVAPWVGNLITTAGDMQSNLGEPRAGARRWINRQLMARARQALESQLEKHTPIVVTDAYEITTGVDDGPAWGQSVYDDTSVEAQLNTIRGYLDSDYVASTTAGLVDADGTWAEIAANYTAYLFTRNQVNKDGESQYQAFGEDCRDRAAMLLAGTIGKVYTNVTATPYLYLRP